jgi:hypothetical protein
MSDELDYTIIGTSVQITQPEPEPQPIVKLEYTLYRVDYIPNTRVYVEQEGKYVDDGTLFTEKLITGRFGKMGMINAVYPDMRASHIILHRDTSDVLFRAKYNINSRTVERVKAKNIPKTAEFGSPDYGKQLFRNIYLSSSFFYENAEFFSHDFDVKFEYFEDALKITFLNEGADATAIANKRKVIDICTRHNMVLQDDPKHNWKFPELNKYFLKCMVDSEYHRMYQTPKTEPQQPTCNNSVSASYSQMLEDDLQCAACQYAAKRTAKKNNIMDILNTADKDLMCEKILNFLEKL